MAYVNSFGAPRGLEVSYGGRLYGGVSRLNLVVWCGGCPRGRRARRDRRAAVNARGGC